MTEPKWLTPPPADEKIVKDGAYIDLPMSRYHSACCKGTSVSSGELRRYYNDGPAEFWGRHPGNENREDLPISEPMLIGRAAHHILLGEEEFSKHFAIRPQEYDSYRSKAAKEWQAMEEANGRECLIPKHLEAIHAIAENLAKHPVAGDLLSGWIERSLIWKDQETGICCKSRPDSIPSAAPVVADLKVSTAVTPTSIQRSIGDQGYHMQMGLAAEGIMRTMGMPIEECWLVVAQNKFPYAVQICRLDDADVSDGIRLNHYVLRRIKERMAEDYWPASEEDEPTMRLAIYHRNRIDWLKQQGMLPDVDLPDLEGDHGEATDDS